MKKKLTTAILALVLSFSLLSTATFAWFSITTQVQVDDMQLRVQTVGSIVIRTYDHNTGSANTRSYSTLIEIPSGAMEGYRVATSDAKFGGADRSGLEPVVLYNSAGINEWSYVGASSGDNQNEVIPNADSIQDSGHNLFYMAQTREDTNDGLIWAEERNQYGRWDIDMVSLDIVTENVAILSKTDIGSESVLTINGENGTNPISSYGSISADQRKRDFLRAFEVYIIEMTPTAEGFGDPTETYTGEDHGALESTPLTGYKIVAHGTFDTHKSNSSADVSGSDFYFDWNETDLGEFAADIPRYFAIVYFINGMAGAHHATNQNHLSGIDVSINIGFKVV